MSKFNAKPARDLHQEVTDKIVALMEANPGSWSRPWVAADGGASGLPFNAVTGNAYRGVNVPMLWAEQKANGYQSAAWGSYKQWQAKGGNVRKGEKGTLIVFYKSLTVQDRTKPQDQDATKRIPLLRCWTVFNRDQVEGLKPEAAKEPAPLMERIAHAEAFVTNTRAAIKHGGNVACYIPAFDLVKMPQPEQFKEREGYYSVLFHELTHWSGDKARTNRDLSGRFGSESYAMEELVAELGAAFLCAALGISSEPREDHAHYIASWLKTLKGDKKAIFTAASKASQAFDFLFGLQPVDDEQEGDLEGQEDAAAAVAA